VSASADDGPHRVVVLGGQRIERGDGSTTGGLPGRRPELVFSYLVVERRRAVTREELADALWPDRLPDSWAAALRGVVSEVRRFLSAGGFDVPSVLVSSGNGWQLQLPPGVTVDLEEARRALDDARVLRTAADHIGAAGAGDGRAAAAAAERLVRADPLDEAGCRLLIEVLGRFGDAAGATRAFERCRELLLDELGVEPSAATRAVLAQATGGGSSTASTSIGEPAGRGGQTPSALSGYSVLVVEDHDFQRRFAVTLLRRIGVEAVLEANSGNTALELLTGQPVDVLLCDLAMPGMDGVELIRHVAEQRLARALAITSGLDRGILETVRAMAQRYGVQVLGLVEKPLSVAALTKVLGEYRPSAGERGNGAALTAEQLQAALAGNEVTSMLAPIVDLARGSLVAAEMVPYWSGGGDAISRALDFGAALDGERVVERLGGRLADLGLAAAAALVARRMPLEIVVRLPHPRFGDPSLGDRLSSLSRVHEVPPRRLLLTVGAVAAGDGSPGALEALARLRVRGFRLLLDDAGQNARLDDAPFTGVRLAPSLVQVSPGNTAAVDLLRRAVGRARERGLTVVGNGCARAEHVEALLEVGASRAQGPQIAPPMALEDFVEWAASWDSADLVSDE
jgi:DNA-binding SARP family transcriptional activator/EAL domain-containing protein (putative c-di-GMP-specific phosphodiesterase class I)/FixJ family two-component response regulator